MQKRNLFVALTVIIIVIIVCLVGYSIFSKKNVSGKLTREYAIENGFLVEKAEGISSYREIFELLAANDIDIMNIKRGDPVVQLSDGDKAKLIDLFTRGARSRELGISKPGWMQSFSGNHDPELKQMFKICHLISPFIEQKGAAKELPLAFLSFGEQLCEYNDKVINLMGIGCKHRSIAFLINNDQGNDELLSKKYRQIEAEIEADFERVKKK